MTAHGILVNECLLALSERGHLVWKHATGEAWTGRIVKHDGGFLTLATPRRVAYGLGGSTDIVGFVKPSGRGLTVECKTGTGRLQKNQKSFRAAACGVGAIHIEARSVVQMMADFDAAMMAAAA